jgi:hypothetical protein
MGASIGHPPGNTIIHLEEIMQEVGQTDCGIRIVDCGLQSQPRRGAPTPIEIGACTHPNRLKVGFWPDVSDPPLPFASFRVFSRRFALQTPRAPTIHVLFMEFLYGKKRDMGIGILVAS